MTTHAASAPETMPEADLHGRRPGAVVNPVWTVARKEWLDIRRDARWRILASVMLLLMLSALASSVVQVLRFEHEHHAAETGDREVWTSQGSKNPHSAAHFGQYAFKPLGPLALADPGIDSYVGNAVHLEAHRQNEVQFRAARDATLAARMGHLTPAFVLQTVLPLMAILLGFSAFTGERERGTLPQLLSLGVRPVHLLLGKWLAGMGVLASLLLVTCLGLAVSLSVLMPPEVADAGDGVHVGDWLRVGGTFLAYALYLAGFLALSLAVSARSRSSRSAMVGLLVFWLFNSFVMPRLVTNVVSRVEPLPTAQAFQEAMTEDKKSLFGHDETHPGFIAFRDRVLKQYGLRRVEDLPVSFRGLSLREDDEAGYRIFDRHFGRLAAQVEGQDELRSRLGFVFPMLSLQPVSMAMAGTDNRHHHRFIRAAEGHRRTIQTAASQDLIDHAKNGDNSYVAPASLWDHIPAFQYRRPDAGWAFRGQLVNLTFLAAWCSACSLFAWYSWLRPRLL